MDLARKFVIALKPKECVRFYIINKKYFLFFFGELIVLSSQEH